MFAPGSEPRPASANRTRTQMNGRLILAACNEKLDSATGEISETRPLASSPAEQLPTAVRATSESEPPSEAGRSPGSGSGASRGRAKPAVSPPTPVLPLAPDCGHVPAGADNNNGAQNESQKANQGREGDENNNGAAGLAIKTLSSRTELDRQVDMKLGQALVLHWLVQSEPASRLRRRAQPGLAGSSAASLWPEIRRAIIVIDNKLCKRLLNQRATGEIERTNISIVPQGLASDFRPQHQDVRIEQSRLPSEQLEATMSNSGQTSQATTSVSVVNKSSAMVVAVAVCVLSASEAMDAPKISQTSPAKIFLLAASKEDLREGASLEMNAEHSNGFIVFEPELGGYTGIRRGPSLVSCLNEAIKVADSYSDTPLEYVASLLEDSARQPIGSPVKYFFSSSSSSYSSSAPSKVFVRLQFTIQPPGLQSGRLHALPAWFGRHRAAQAREQVYRPERAATITNLATGGSRTSPRQSARRQRLGPRQISDRPTEISPAWPTASGPPLIKQADIKRRKEQYQIQGPSALSKTNARFKRQTSNDTNRHGSYTSTRSRQGCALFDDKSYVIYSSLGSFYIPMLIMIFFYYRIYLVASRAQKALQRGYMTTKWPPSCLKQHLRQATTANTARLNDPSAALLTTGKSEPASSRNCNGGVHLRWPYLNNSSASKSQDEHQCQACSQSADSKTDPRNKPGHSLACCVAVRESLGEQVTLRIHRREKSPTVALEDLANSTATNSNTTSTQQQPDQPQDLGLVSQQKQKQQHQEQPPFANQQQQNSSSSLRRVASLARTTYYPSKVDARPMVSGRQELNRAILIREPLANHSEADDQRAESKPMENPQSPRTDAPGMPVNPEADDTEDKRRLHHKHHHHRKCRCHRIRRDHQERKRRCRHHRCRHHRDRSTTHASEAPGAVQITVSSYDDSEAMPSTLNQAQSCKQDARHTAKEPRDSRVDCDQSCESQRPPEIMLNWSQDEQANSSKSTSIELAKLEAGQSRNKLMESKSVESGRSASAVDGSQASGLSLVANIPSQVRKQSMILLSCLTSRSSQTLRRLSMVATHPVGSLLNRAWSRDDNRGASSSDSDFSLNSDLTGEGKELDCSVKIGHNERPLTSSGTNQDGPGTPTPPGGRNKRRGRRPRDKRARRHKSAGGAGKRTLDDYLMAVAGIDGTSSEEDEVAFDGQSFEDDSDLDDESNLSRRARAISPLLIQSTSTVAAVATACMPIGEQSSLRLIDSANHDSGELAAVGARANPYEDAQAVQPIEPDEPSVEGRLRRQGGLYERATSRTGAECSDSAKTGALSAPSQPARSGLVANPVSSYLRRTLGRTKSGQSSEFRPIQIRLDVASKHINLDGADCTQLGHRRATKRTSRWHAKRLRAETKAAKTVAIIIGGFIFCWLPFFTAYLSRSILCARPDCIPQSLLSLFTWLGYLNSAINPVIYGLFSADFRLAFKNILCRCRFRGNDDAVVVSVLVDSIIKSIL